MSDILKYFFEPKSVAIIGASKTPGKAGNEILVNMLANGYAGKIYPVNPSGEEIMGLSSYRSVKEIPERVDLAVFIVPAEKTLEPLRECIGKKIPAAVILSAGYAEVNDQGARLQEEILAMAKASGMRIIGPNTSGLSSTPASLTTTLFPLGKIRRGPISYIAQTGNFATHTMKWIMTAENFGVALSNPVDMSPITPTLGPVRAYQEVIELLLQDDGVDAVIPILLASPNIPAEQYGYLPELSSKYPHKPIYATFTGDKQSFDQARAFLEQRSIPVFIPLEDALEALQVLCRCREARERGKI